MAEQDIIEIDLGDSVRLAIDLTNWSAQEDFTGWTLEVFDVSPELVGHVTAIWSNAALGEFVLRVNSITNLTIGNEHSFRVRTYPTGNPNDAWALPRFRLRAV